MFDTQQTSCSPNPPILHWCGKSLTCIWRCISCCGKFQASVGWKNIFFSKSCWCKMSSATFKNVAFNYEWGYTNETVQQESEKSPSFLKPWTYTILLWFIEKIFVKQREILDGDEAQSTWNTWKDSKSGTVGESCLLCMLVCAQDTCTVVWKLFGLV